MNRYESSIPRVPFAFAAVALAALTMTVTVVVPSQMEPRVHAARALAAAKTVAPGAAIGPARIDVFGVRAQKTAFEPARHGAPDCAQAT